MLHVRLLHPDPSVILQCLHCRLQAQSFRVIRDLACVKVHISLSHGLFAHQRAIRASTGYSRINKQHDKWPTEPSIDQEDHRMISYHSLNALIFSLPESYRHKAPSGMWALPLFHRVYHRCGLGPQSGLSPSPPPCIVHVKTRLLAARGEKLSVAYTPFEWNTILQSEAFHGSRVHVEGPQ